MDNVRALRGAPRSAATAPRKPSRGRGVVRFEALLQATERLLQTHNPDEVGLYQIAEQAGVPPASVYHFFPTKEAAYLALFERFLEGLIEVQRQPLEARQIKSWQDLFRHDALRGMVFYNAHPAALKINYGGYGGVETRSIDILIGEKMAAKGYDRLDAIFHMPVMHDPHSRFRIRISILDAIWSLSVRKHGRITEEFFEHSMEACIAYTQTFLPTRLEPRALLIDAAKRGDMIALPYVEPNLELVAKGSPLREDGGLRR